MIQNPATTDFNIEEEEDRAMKASNPQTSRQA